MDYTTRCLEERLEKAFEGPLITAVLGPRRVGKTTLIHHYLQKHPQTNIVSLNMDSLSQRETVERGELETMILTTLRRHLEPNQLVVVAIDEAQKCPALFDQIKILYDRYKDQKAIKFILTGSALLDLHRLSAESLAGRIHLYTLSAFNLLEAAHLQHQINLPSRVFEQMFSEKINEKAWEEVFHALKPYSTVLQETLMDLLCWGGFPEILLMKTTSDRLDYLANYLQTYLEKDVRALHSITDLTLYRHLMEIIATQTGSIRDDTRLIEALGCHRETLNKYRSYLSATLLYQDISPYIHSPLKRLVKAPKGYLTNNGLVSFLEGIYDPILLNKTGKIGHRLENWFLTELSAWLNRCVGHHSIHYWRTSGGAEVDFIVKAPPFIIPFEVTHTSQIDPKKVRHLLHFREYEPEVKLSFYIYNGDFKLDLRHQIIFLPAWAIC